MRRRVIRLGGADASIYHTFCGMFCVLAQPSAFVIFRAFVTLSANQTYGNFWTPSQLFLPGNAAHIQGVAFNNNRLRLKKS